MDDLGYKKLNSGYDPLYGNIIDAAVGNCTKTKAKGLNMVHNNRLYTEKRKMRVAIRDNDTGRMISEATKFIMRRTSK